MKRRSGSALGHGGLSLLVTWASLALAAGCSSEPTGGLPPLLTADGSTPPPVAVAPTISPNLTPITFRPGPDFAPITPPPVQPDLPDPPQFGPGGGFNVDQPFASLSYRVDLTNLIVRGGIASVDIQVLNITCGTDVTGVIRPEAISQFRNLLVGRGNTFADANGFNFSYTFPTDPRFFDDLRIFSKGIRRIENREILTGDDIVFVLTIRDAFGQVLRVDDSIFNPGETRSEVRGSAIPPCSNLPQPTPTPTPTPLPPVPTPTSGPTPVPTPVPVGPSPLFARFLLPNPAPVNTPVTLTFVVDNRVAGAIPLSGLSFQAVLPEGLVVANPPTPAGIANPNTCGGTLGAIPGTRIINLSGGVLAAGATCEVNVSIQATAPGIYTLPLLFVPNNQTLPSAAPPITLVAN
ncbi:hypothetical protein [Synechococcus sp. W70.1]|uniref:DUF7933 domain-containing protein n=1 Tax=Synechococcus sp. W70.1 TaxID=2964534 RepID=UPI0039C2B856